MNLNFIFLKLTIIKRIFLNINTYNIKKKRILLFLKLKIFQFKLISSFFFYPKKAFMNSYKQKNEDFKKLFKLPPEEHLLVDYSCALQKEILAHGRLYISLNYVCFRANIIGWETTVFY